MNSFHYYLFNNSESISVLFRSKSFVNEKCVGFSLVGFRSGIDFFFIIRKTLSLIILMRFLVEGGIRINSNQYRNPSAEAWRDESSFNQKLQEIAALMRILQIFLELLGHSNQGFHSTTVSFCCFILSSLFISYFQGCESGGGDPYPDPPFDKTQDQNPDISFKKTDPDPQKTAQIRPNLDISKFTFSFDMKLIQ